MRSPNGAQRNFSKGLPVDSTNFTTLFGGTDSIENFWRYLAAMR
jgi:hypothetical protein